MLKHVGHGFSQPADWLLQFKQAFAALVAKPTVTPSGQEETLKDLPFIEVHDSALSGDTLAVILSGDGGCASIDWELGNTLVRQGVPVVGLNSLQYF